jgi:hypothetical protein
MYLYWICEELTYLINNGYPLNYIKKDALYWICKECFDIQSNLS